MLLISIVMILVGFRVEASEVLQTCAQQHGYVCSVASDCFGSIAQASDTSSCCDIACGEKEDRCLQKCLAVPGATTDECTSWCSAQKPTIGTPQLKNNTCTTDADCGEPIVCKDGSSHPTSSCKAGNCVKHRYDAYPCKDNTCLKWCLAVPGATTEECNSWCAK